MVFKKPPAATEKVIMPEGARKGGELINPGQNETVGHNETVALLWVPESRRARVCEIYISSRELEAILLNHQQ